MTTDLATVERATPGSEAGTYALAALSPEDFAERLEALKRGRERIAAIQRELMEENTDYGEIPGTAKPTLLKPGAEKLCDFYRLAADFIPTIEYGDGEHRPHIRVLMRCELHLGTFAGPVVATGYGAANSWEKRYRYRKAERVCPECGKPGLRFTRRNVWWHPSDAPGCNANFAKDDERITGQEQGQVDNPDPWDLEVTIVKMAEKRAHVDATLRATASSGLFTQDIEEQGAVAVEMPHTDSEAGLPDIPAQPAPGRIGMGELRQRVVDIADEHSMPLEVLAEVIDSAFEGRTLGDLSKDELIALGTAITQGRYDLPTDPTPDEQATSGSSEADASVVEPAMTSGVGHLTQVVIDRYWNKVDAQEEGCWPWTGTMSGSGYGEFTVDGVRTTAHRVAWQIVNGPIPEGMQIDHLCRNRPCVNPDHLELVTQQENISRGDHGAGKLRVTHCSRGHLYTPETTNWYRRANGRQFRQCSICEVERRKPGSDLQAVLNLTGGELVDDGATGTAPTGREVGAAASGQPSRPTKDATEAAEKARARAARVEA